MEKTTEQYTIDTEDKHSVETQKEWSKPSIQKLAIEDTRGGSFNAAENGITKGAS